MLEIFVFLNLKGNCLCSGSLSHAGRRSTLGSRGGPRGSRGAARALLGDHVLLGPRGIHRRTKKAVLFCFLFLFSTPPPPPHRIITMIRMYPKGEDGGSEQKGTPSWAPLALLDPIKEQRSHQPTQLLCDDEREHRPPPGSRQPLPVGAGAPALSPPAPLCSLLPIG